jgi:hypothetical protein
MTINNPLADNSPDHEDQNLVLRARSGDRQALEDLVQPSTGLFTIGVGAVNLSSGKGGIGGAKQNARGCTRLTKRSRSP